MNLPVARGILGRYARYGWTQPGGEWGHINAEPRQEFKATLDSGHPEHVAAYLNKLFCTPLYFGLVSLGDDIDKTLPTQVVWRLAIWAHLTGSRDVRALAAPLVGTPIVVQFGDVHVQVDTPRFDIYAQRIAALQPATVLEFGGGYGGVARQTVRRCAARWFLVDIPETLYVAWYWLAGATDRRIAWWDDDPTADIVLLPHSELETSGVQPDTVVAFHTLSGLPPSEIARYMAWLEGSGARHFYHDDAVEPTPEGVWLSNRFAETLAQDFGVPACYELVRAERIPWAGLNDRFREALYAKR